jgi:arsenate reductase-like glutaredoxin family protein
MKIYSYKKDSLTSDNLVSILEKDGVFTAMTRSDSKDFMNFNAAKEWLAKRGYETVIDVEVL